MSATVLTPEAAKAANIEIVSNGKYTQAVHETVVAYRAARRSGTACVKTKATVSGSGAKPWRQKGTGRARAGYKSSPVWVGGGVVFGPHPRDYSKKISKKTKRIALRKALSLRIIAGDVLVVPTFTIANPKTKDFVAAVGNISKDGKTLIVAPEFDNNTKLAARNVSTAQLITSADVNTEDLLRYKKIVVTNEALTQLAQRLNK
jgi:large subunit ribosomal protein L4